ncbi:hypothetical protein CGRA01v4_03544 [Colletotrichum graminicola]|nr:hypothetical protein CGRA01v4_03544 [Colletotrichum graminicola]
MPLMPNITQVPHHHISRWRYMVPDPSQKLEREGHHKHCNWPKGWVLIT